MAQQTVTARIARILEVIQNAIDEMDAEESSATREMSRTLEAALTTLQSAYDTAAAGLIISADDIILSRYFVDYDGSKRYVYQFAAKDGHPKIKLIREEDYVVPSDDDDSVGDDAEPGE